MLFELIFQLTVIKLYARSLWVWNARKEFQRGVKIMRPCMELKCIVVYGTGR